MYEYLDRRYALALYEVAEEKGKVEEYLNELTEIVDLINNSESLLQIIKHPHLSTAKKKQMFSDIFKGKIYDDIFSFLLVLLEKNRILELNAQLKEMKKIHLEKNNTLSVFVKTVISLDNEQRESLIKNLEKKYNKKILLHEEIDKNIIGGVFLRVGNDVIDGSIRSKFEEIRKLTLKVE